MRRRKEPDKTKHVNEEAGDKCDCKHPGHQRDLPLQTCAPIRDHVSPDQTVAFQCEITSPNDPSAAASLSLDCWSTNASLKVSLLADFEQKWHLARVAIGDHATTYSLSPLEIVTLEMRRLERSLLESSREVASALEQASEQTTSDKESLNVANTSSRSSNWSISASGSFSVGGVGANAGITDAQTVSSSLSSTLATIHETTEKSTRKLQTQTKIQIHGVTETAIDNRETRHLSNPYPDRSLHLHIYEINKEFDVSTALVNIRSMLTIHVHPLELGNPTVVDQFIEANLPFLQETLFDTDLRDALPEIGRALRTITSMKPLSSSAALDALEDYLFGNRPEWQPYHAADAARDVIYDSSQDPAIGALADASDGSAVLDAQSVNKGGSLPIYFVLHTLHTIRDRSHPFFVEQRPRLLGNLGKFLSTAWPALSEGNRGDLLDKNERTELFRRIPGFLYLYDSLLADATTPGTTIDDLTSITAALRRHLACHRTFYTEQFLHYLWERLGKSFVLSVVNGALMDLIEGPVPAGKTRMVDNCAPYRNLYRADEVDRDGMCILVPFSAGASEAISQGATEDSRALADQLEGLASAVGDAEEPDPQTDQFVVPADGVHIEPVPGDCVLPLVEMPGRNRGSQEAGDSYEPPIAEEVATM